MIKHFLIIVSCLFIMLNAQAQAVKIGGGIATGNGFYFQNNSADEFKSGTFAFLINGIIDTKTPFKISPSFTVFLPNSTETASGQNTVSSFMFDLNGHYIFNKTSAFSFYGLAGIDILYAKMKTSIKPLDDITDSDNTIGLNIGAGSGWSISDRISINGELKYVFGKYSQLLMNVGVLFKI